MMDNGKQVRWWDIPAILFLFTCLWIVVWRIQATRWTSELYRLEVLVLMAYLLGIFLGRSKFSKIIIRLMALAYTLFFIPWQLGLILGQDVAWIERLQSLWGRLQHSSALFASNQPVEDPLLFLTSVSILYWLLSISSGYMLVRYGKPWVPLVLSGVALFVLDFYHPFFGLRAWFDGGFLLLALLLVSRVYFLKSRKIWDDRGSVLDPEVGLNLGSTVFISSLVLILIAWNFPLFIEAMTPGTAMRERVIIAWTGIRNRLGNAVAGLAGTPVYEAAAYSNQMQLGSGRRLSDELVFTVESSQPLSAGKRYYWRGYSYNHYSLGYWRSTLEYIEDVGPRDWNFPLPVWSGRREVQFTFIPETRLQKTIFSPTFPVSASRAARVLLVNEVGVYDPVSLQVDEPLRPGEMIQLEAYISIPTIKQMREASDTFPEWVTERYLALPDDLSPSIQSLAENITASENNQYDKVVAITNYLRTEYEYQEVIPNVPRGKDPVEWFLFDLRKGFCNYYASAEVLMLRSIGIPSRLAVGYAQGDLQPGTSNTYLVRERDGHAWPEVYFAELGWVEFEPTASEPVLVYPSGIEQNQREEGDERFLERDQPYPDSNFPPRGDESAGPTYIPKPNNLFSNLVAYAILLSAIGTLVWLATDKIKIQFAPLPLMLISILERWKLKAPSWLSYWARWIGLTPIEKLYERLGRLIKLTGAKVSQGQTPAERINQLVMAHPNLRFHAMEFLVEYQRAEYSHHPASYTRAWYAFRKMERRVLVIWIKKIIRI